MGATPEPPPRRTVPRHAQPSLDLTLPDRVTVPILYIGQRTGGAKTFSGSHGGFQRPVLIPEDDTVVQRALLRTLANMACSRGRGPANRLAGMIVLPDSAVSRKRKGKPLGPQVIKQSERISADGHERIGEKLG